MKKTIKKIKHRIIKNKYNTIKIAILPNGLPSTMYKNAKIKNLSTRGKISFFV